MYQNFGGIAILSILTLIRTGIIAVTGIFGYFLYNVPNKKKRIKETNASWASLTLLGTITMFFDTLGIGSYAPLTFVFKQFKIMSDRLIPGTLNTCTVLPASMEALIYITIIEVEPITLVSMIIAACLGAYLGAGFVAKLPEKKIQIGMGAALLIVALIILAGLLNLMPIGGESIGLSGWKLAIALIANFVIGALMTIGIGAFAPIMAVVYLLGLSPRVSFPIMMGSCAFLIPIAGIKFIKEDSFDLKCNIAIPLGGIIGILVAAYIVKELPLTLLKWLVVIVVLYTSMIMFRSALKKDKTDKKSITSK